MLTLFDIHLFSTSFYRPDEAQPFENVASILRLSSKYELESLRKDTILWLFDAWPNDVTVYEVSMCRGDRRIITSPT